MKREGCTTHVLLVGDLCVRVLKDPDFASDIYTEAVAAPAAFRAGVLTPELFVFDTDLDAVESELTIFRRVEGEPLGMGPDNEDIYMEVARQAALWHRGVTEVDDPNDWLDKPHPNESWESLRLAKDWLPESDWIWAERWLRRLETAEPATPAFLHWDLHWMNLMVLEGKLPAVIDWGDAGWGDPALNFTYFPAHLLPNALNVFGDESYDMVGRTLREAVGRALDSLEEAPQRWASLMSLWDQGLGSVWKEWMGDRPGACP